RHSYQGIEHLSEGLFTGTHFVKYHAGDSSGTIYPTSLYAAYIKWYLGGAQLYGMFESDFKRYFPSRDDVRTLLYFGTERVGSFLCYHYRHSHQYITSPTTDQQPLQRITDLWINRADSFPVKYSISSTYVTVKDTAHSYYEETLTSYALNCIPDMHLFTMSSIPSFYRLTEYSP